MRAAAMAAFGRLPAGLRRVLVRLGSPSYTVGAVLVLRLADGRVLLVDQRHTGAWALPGGLLRRGEDPVAGVVREVAEEVDVVLDPAELGVPQALVAPRAQRVDLVFVLDTADDRHARTGDAAEVKRIGWFHPTGWPELSEPTRDILDAVLPR
ncbi:MAG TPA: NUDIX domain-containing protein [Mycobacteriales bacterium]|nr:NUDIX domain-containing protein [Mycobacteriales bacterium]